MKNKRKVESTVVINGKKSNNRDKKVNIVSKLIFTIFLTEKIFFRFLSRSSRESVSCRRENFVFRREICGILVILEIFLTINPIVSNPRIQYRVQCIGVGISTKSWKFISVFWIIWANISAKIVDNCRSEWNL